MSMKILNGLDVDGKIKGNSQAAAAGEVPILEDDGVLPGRMIPERAVPFTVPASAWQGDGPYTADVVVADAASIATPIIGPVNPDGAMREVLASAQITVLGMTAGGVVSMVADGDKPLVPIECIATGTVGNRSSYVISAFGAGGGGVDFFMNVNVTASAGTPSLAGIAVTATPTTGPVLNGTTGADGKATLGVKQGMTYTVALSKTNYTITPASSTITVQDTTTTINATCYEAPTLTVTCTGAGISGRLITATPTSGSIKTATTNSSGTAVMVLEIKDYTITCDYPTGQGVSPVNASVSASAGGTYSRSFTVLAQPVINVSVVDHSGSQASGRTITATPTSGTAITATTNASGAASLTMPAESWTMSCAVPAGYVPVATQAINAVAGQTYTVTFDMYLEAIVNVTVAPDAVRAGRTVTASASGFTSRTMLTNASGVASFSLPQATWTFSVDTPTGYYAAANQTQATTPGQTYALTFTIARRPLLTINVTPSAGGAGIPVSAVGPNTVTGNTNSSGTVTLTLDEGTYTVGVTPGSTYLVPATQSVTTARDNAYTLNFAVTLKPVINVTVTDSSGAGNQSGRTVTATNGTSTVSAVTNASGQATLRPDWVGSCTVTSNTPTGATVNSVALTMTAGSTYTAALTLTFSFKFTMNLNSTTMQTDPTGCLTYGDDCAGFTPLVNTNTTFASVPTGNRGSWIQSTNPLLKKLYYATFNTNGTIAEILNPDNLALDQYGNSSSITTKNTMLVIPTLYTKGESGKLTLSDKSAEGTAHAHTIGGHVYDYLAIGVYNGYVSGGKLMSLSGVLPTKSQNRANFRTQANANGTNWMLWNYWHWKLLKELTFFTLKSFDGQGKLGYGGHAYGSNTTGVTNAMGMFAGKMTSGDAMKCFIEDWWCSQYQFIDDFYGNGGTYYAGQNAIPTDDTSNKTQVITGLTTGWWYGNTIDQSDKGWGIANSAGGNTATCLCDGQNGSMSSGLLGRVGGYSGSDLNAGPSFLRASDALSTSDTAVGARLAFVFND